ncbi:MAG: hypothetical protein LUH05_04060 [Candidatus Gastranaerophilales bacterium]|nr:hypothetical protein [Candidatus Gastranaerophilales bacterium]
MNIQEAMLLISLKKKNIYSIADLGRCLNLSRQYLQKYKEKELDDEQIHQLETFYNVNLKYSLNIADAIEVKYYNSGIEELDNKVIKNPHITSIWLDKELVRKVWKIKDENTLKLISMPGDCMDGGETPIKNGDLLLIDTSVKNALISGVYAYITQSEVYKKTLLFVCRITQNTDGSITMIPNKKEYEAFLFDEEHLRKIDFKIIGRMIKNISELD